MKKPVIGFVGIGSMGWPMAHRIAAAGYRLLVADSDLARTEKFCTLHDAELAVATAGMSMCSMVVTMLPTSSIVEQALLGPGGLSEKLKPGAMVIEMSSGNPSHTVRLAGLLGRRSLRLVDAPVSGGVKRAESGELSIMVGGANDDVSDAMPILSTMGTTITRTGGVGSAHAMKALNNLVSATGLVASVEALLIGKKFGLDPSLMVDVLNSSTGMNNSTQKKLKQFVLSGGFDSGFGLDLMLKDLGIAMELAREGGAAAPLSSACRQLWEAAHNVLGSGHDHTEIALLSGLLAGVQLSTKIEGSPAA